MRSPRGIGLIKDNLQLVAPVLGGNVGPGTALSLSIVVGRREDLSVVRGPLFGAQLPIGSAVLMLVVHVSRGLLGAGPAIISCGGGRKARAGAGAGAGAGARAGARARVVVEHERDEGSE